MLIILFFLSFTKHVDISNFTTDSPKIDGIIEDAWLQADSLSNFVQMQPFEKSEPSEHNVKKRWQVLT